MSYDFFLVAASDPTEGDFAKASAFFEDKFSLEPAGNSDHLILALAEERLALISTPVLIDHDELLRVYGENVASQLGDAAWASEVNCPEDKDTAEAVRMFLMIAVAGSRGLVIDPQSNEILNALDS